MSTMIALRGLTRSKSVDVSGKPIRRDVTTWANIDNPRVQRDIARHSAIGGAVFPVGNTYFQNDAGVVDGGGKITVRAATLVTDVSATVVTKTNGTKLSVAAGAAPALGAADATNPRIDIIAVDTSAAGAYVVVAGAATAGANLINRLGMAALPANRIALAAIVVPATATTLTQTNVADIRP